IPELYPLSLHDALPIYAFKAFGERDDGTVWLHEAVVAFREALKEWTRERAPLDWAMAQNNLGNALHRLGEHESETVRLDEAVAADRKSTRLNSSHVKIS